MTWLAPIRDGRRNAGQGMTSIPGPALGPLGLTQRSSSGPGGVKTWQDTSRKGAQRAWARRIWPVGFRGWRHLGPDHRGGVHGALHAVEWWQPGYQGGGEKSRRPPEGRQGGVS